MISNFSHSLVLEEDIPSIKEIMELSRNLSVFLTDLGEMFRNV